MSKLFEKGEGCELFKKYRTGELLKYLGVSRDTLRFYEEKGLLNPKKDDENNYRGYNIFDIFRIMIIDFYKKRGMTIQQIQNLLNKSELKDLQYLLENKKNELEKIVYDAQCMLKRIEETQKFSKDLSSNLNTFTLKPLPLYRVNGEVSDFTTFEEYENVIDIINSKNGDMLSQIMRYISFDQNSINGTKMIIVDTAEDKSDKGLFLKYPNCLYTVKEEIQPKKHPIDLMEIMHKSSYEYANQHGLRLLGEAFAIIRLITYQQNETKSYMEIFIPFE